MTDGMRWTDQKTAFVAACDVCILINVMIAYQSFEAKPKNNATTHKNSVAIRLGENSPANYNGARQNLWFYNSKTHACAADDVFTKPKFQVAVV